MQQDVKERFSGNTIEATYITTLNRLLILVTFFPQAHLSVKINYLHKLTDFGCSGKEKLTPQKQQTPI